MAVTTTYDMETTVSAFTANSFINGDEFGASVVSLGDGGFAISYGWALGTSIGPLVNRDTNGDGVITGDFTIPYSVADADVNMLGDPDITRLADGNLAVVWDSATQGGGDIRSAIINATTGAVVHTDFEVSPFVSDTDPQVAGLANGNWVVVSNNGSDVFAQLMSATGAKIGAQIGLDIPGARFDASVCALNDGGFAVAWTASNGFLTGPSVFVAVRNADGSQRLAATEVAAGGFLDNNSQSTVAALQNGGFALVYKDSGWSGDGLSLHIFNAAGVSQVGLIRVDPPAFETQIEQDPDITVLSNGMIAVTWTHPTSATNDDIVGRLFTDTGVPVQVGGSDAFFIATSGVHDRASSVAALLEGRFVTTWTDAAPETGGSGSAISGEVRQLTEEMNGDAADDIITGTALRSFLLGGDGNDRLDGGAGDDTLRGDSGNDSLQGGAGNDLLFGGDDTLLAGSGDDSMLGGDGTDSLFGGGGNDIIASDGDTGLYDGGDGNDLMTSAAGGETMLGGDGNDTIDHSWFGDDFNFDMVTGLTNFGSESYTAFETALMGAGNDSVSGTTAADTMFGGGGRDRLFGGDGGDDLRGGTQGDSLSGGAGNDALSGNGARDLLRGGRGDDALNGGAGQDRLSGGAGQDALRGGAGTDRLFGAAGDDTLQGGAGADRLFGGGGDDTLQGGGGRDRMFGGGGADRFQGDAGDDLFNGGGGRDIFVFGRGSGRDLVTRFDNGADRVDLVGVTFNQLTESAIAGGVRLSFGANRLDLMGVSTAEINAGDFLV